MIPHSATLDNSVLLVIDAINSCAHTEYEDSDRGITYSKIRQMIPSLSSFITSSYNMFARKWYPRDNGCASSAVRWAVLHLRVAPQGDFKTKIVAHAERHFKLAYCSRAAQGCRQSSHTRGCCPARFPGIPS